MKCAVDGCSNPATYDVLCDIHVMHKVWRDNSDIRNLGIVRFSHDLFPTRINKIYGTPPMHMEIYADLLDARYNGNDKMDRMHVVAAPREHSKSTIISFVWPLYNILFKITDFIVLISESHSKTVQFIRAIKSALASPLVKQYFGNISAKDMEEGGKWTEGHIVTNTGVHVMALGMGKSARGLIEDTRPGLVIADDVESENNTKTQESRDNNWDWWKAQVVPAADMILGQCVYIGTMVHYDCTLARLFDYQPDYVPGKGGYRKRFYQVWKDDAGTKPIWPAKFPVSLVKKIEEDYVADPNKGPDQFYREYLNIAVAPSSRRFPDSVIQFSDIKYSRPNGPGTPAFLEFPDGSGIPGRIAQYTNCSIVIGIDPASSKRDTAANTGIVVLATTPDARRYVLHTTRRKMYLKRGPGEVEAGLVEEFVSLIKTYEPDIVAIEVTGVGRPIAQELRVVLYELRKTNPEIKTARLVEIEALPTISKEENIINSLEIPFKAQQIFLLKQHNDLISELKQFPKGRYVDLVDALADAYKVSYVPPTIRYEHPQNRQKNPLLDPKYHERRRPVRDWETMV